jgi:hypothetical protein
MLSRGFIYATTGADYTVLARRSARNLRLVMPDAQIDLFTDQDITDPVFDQIHRLIQSTHRPKMEAMLRSRFDRNVLLDADTIAVADVSDLFDILDRCHIAGALAYGRESWGVPAQKGIPRAFPYLNGGMLAFRRSPRMLRLIAQWKTMVVDNERKHDQPSLRALLYRHNVPLIVLPHYYNLIYPAWLDSWEGHFGPPLILHIFDLHKNPPGNPELPFDLVKVLGRRRAGVVRQSLARERLREEQSAQGRSPSGPRGPVTGLDLSISQRARHWIKRRARWFRR